MAWVTEYDCTWWNRNGTVGGNVYIQRDGGSYQQPLTMSFGSLEIRRSLGNWDSGVIRSTCTFSIENDLSDFYTLMPLMTISAGQMKVVVTTTGGGSGGATLFEGYLNCEAVSQDMVRHSNIKLVASGLLSKLEHVYPVDVDTVQYMTLIDIIDACLVLTGSAYNIRILHSLYELRTPLSTGQSLFNRTGLWTEIFWTNNIDRMMGLEILETILKTFNAYLYWHDGYWYIEHYEDLGDALNSPYQKTYVEYTTGVSYGGTDAGSEQTVTIGVPGEIHDPDNKPQVYGKQMLSVNPGMRQINIRKDHKTFYNMINWDLTDVTLITTSEVTPDRRTWNAFDPPSGLDWLYPGLPAFFIENSIYRSGYDISTYSQQLNGLTTRFMVTVQSDTELTIKFKWIWVGAYPGFLTSPGNYEIHFYYYLRNTDDDYYVYGTSTGDWTLVSSGSPTVDYNTYVVSGTELNLDGVLPTFEGSFTVSLGEALAPSDAIDQDLVFRMGHELIVPLVSGSDSPAMWCWYGDFEATISETPEENLLEGTLVTDFLDKKEISIDIFDSTWSYKSALLRYALTGSYWVLTRHWTYDHANYDTVARWLLISKFRLYNTARQKIDVTYISSTPYQLMQIWTDSKQSGKYFILTGDAFRPEADEHDLSLWEYDNTTEINLI